MKAKTLNPDPAPEIIPNFDLATADAIQAETWNEIDNVVQNGNSFEVTSTFAVIGLNGRHAICTASNGTRYLIGYVQDREGVIRYLSVWDPCIMCNSALSHARGAPVAIL